MSTKRVLTAAEQLILRRISHIKSDQEAHQSQEEELRSRLEFVAFDSGRFDSVSHVQVLARIAAIRRPTPTSEDLDPLPLPSLVFQDCPAMHTTTASVAAARKHNIFLVGLPHNSSWYLQQGDDIPFMYMKSEHYRRVKKYRKLHGNSPNLFDTLKIFLESRKKVLTRDVIRDSFMNVGQYDQELKGPSSRQILKKAADARVRCSGTENWTETDEIGRGGADLQEKIALLDPVVRQLSTDVAVISPKRPLNRRDRRITPELLRIEKKIADARRRVAEANTAQAVSELQEAQQQIYEFAAAPLLNCF